MSKPKSETCPLCGSIPTDYHDSLGGELMRASWAQQICASMCCGLPCRLWDKVEELLNKIRRYESRAKASQGKTDRPG